MPTSEDLAKIAYSAYGQSTDGLNFRGEPMPAWEKLPGPIQLAWEVAAISIRTALNAHTS